MPASTIWLWALCIFMLTTPFYFILTGTSPDISVARDAATGRRPEGANLGFYLLRMATLGLALFLSRNKLHLPVRPVPRSWPMLLFVGWAALSLAWSDTFGTSLNALFSLCSLVAVSLIISNRLKPNEIVRATIYAGLILAVSSFFWSIVVPSQGVHQLTDAGQSVHAGNWRGVFIHKNALGQACAMFGVIAVLAGRESASLALRLTLAFLMFVLIILSESGSGLVVFVVAPFIALIFVFVPPWMRIFVFGFALFMGLLFYTYSDDILALMGRDATLTGRTAIWNLALSYIRENPFSGYGYMSSYNDFAFQAQRTANVFEPHNGYIDITLGTGLVGLTLFIIAAGASLRAARHVYLAGGQSGRGALPLAGATSAWLVACLAESAARPTGATAAMGFLSLGIMTYRGWELARPAGRKAVLAPISA